MLADFRDDRASVLLHGVGAGGHPDAFRAPVVGVGDALDVAESLELIDGPHDGGLGQLGSFSEVGDPRALGRDVRGDREQGGACIDMSACHQLTREELTKRERWIAQQVAEVTMPRVGDWYENENVKTKEIARVLVTPEDTGGRLLEVELWVAPGARVPAEHVHDRLVERFTVLEGELSVLVGGRASTAVCDDSVLVPAGEPHDWWNASDEVARVKVDVEATPGSGPMAGRFAAMIEAGFGLANTGRTNDQGLPTPLWLASLAHEYGDVIRFVKPPRAIQRAIFGPLAVLARHTGRDVTAAWLHGPGCPAQITAPAERELAATRA